MAKHVPILLILSRLLFAVSIYLLIPPHSFDSTWIVLILLYVGILSDVFDGIVARKLNISTQRLRLLDTLVDLLFYISLLLYIIQHNPSIWSNNLFLIITILALEGSMYAISLLRFRKLPSPHAILSKFWGIYLVIEFTLVILGVTGSHFQIALYFGLAAHIDRILIYSFIRAWDHDIPSSYHAFLLRQRKSIQRRKLFNG